MVLAVGQREGDSAAGADIGIGPVWGLMMLRSSSGLC